MSCVDCGCPLPCRPGHGRPPKRCDGCKRLNAARVARERYANERAAGVPVRKTHLVQCAGGCGAMRDGGRGSLPAGQRKCRACRARGRAAQCLWCGNEFRFASARKYCSSACRYAAVSRWPSEAERNRHKCRKRRAMKQGLPSESYTLGEIAVRDEFRCGICGSTVDLTLSGSDPEGPTIDHVIPISGGGPDLRSNIQLAHRVCNTAKGARWSGAATTLAG